MKYKRILLKLRGEALMGNLQYGIDTERLKEYAREIKKVVEVLYISSAWYRRWAACCLVTTGW